MKKHSDYKHLDKIPDSIWTKFKIVVPTENDKKLLMEAFEHIHYSDIDTNFVTVNELAHQYQPVNSIVVNKELYESLI